MMQGRARLMSANTKKIIVDWISQVYDNSVMKLSTKSRYAITAIIDLA